MNKRILLVEPAYKTKYPPLGLMKIATYHKSKNDDVVFVKGCKKDGVEYQYWDRVYISTLFTWTWEETVKTINFYRNILFDFSSKCFIGGILASLMHRELYNATGIQPVIGLLDDPKKLNQDDNTIIDSLSPDYSILEKGENDNFQYSNTDAYLGYMTRGCIRNCKFCAVKTLEPTYVSYIDMKPIVNKIEQNSGKKQNLVLMDNNVLASNKFDTIIDDIISMGFTKNAVFGPNKRKRIVDFNQGLDARLLTEHKMQRLAEIPLAPMRLAFDSIDQKDAYVRAVRLAHKYGQRDMSNYILYNYEDSPEDFYERLRINIDLNEEFKNGDDTRTIIYSFPMRFIPLNAKTRSIDTGNNHWNLRYLRGLQLILNVMKGPVMPGREFFLQAFGRNSEEFKMILLMPDEFIRNRLVDNWRVLPDYESRLMPYVKDWMNDYFSLGTELKELLIKILASNNKVIIENSYQDISAKKVLKMLKCHLKDAEIVSQYKEIR